jgi:hypothetical protein
MCAATLGASRPLLGRIARLLRICTPVTVIIGAIGGSFDIAA